MNDKITGPISVNGDITPITHQKIEQVTPDKWEKMSIIDLWEQHNIIYNRICIATQVGNSEIVRQLGMGMTQLEALIESKANIYTNI